MSPCPKGSRGASDRIRGVKGPAGAGSPEGTPRFSAWTPPMVVFMGKPRDQVEAEAAA